MLNCLYVVEYGTLYVCWTLINMSCSYIIYFIGCINFGNGLNHVLLISGHVLSVTGKLGYNKRNTIINVNGFAKEFSVQ